MLQSLMKTSPSVVRQQWLEDAGAALRKLFLEKGYKVRREIRYTIGWPKGSHGGKKAIGQCWATDASADKHNEIFVSPEIGHSGKPGIENSIALLGVLAHEFCHAVSGHAAGHRVIKRPGEPPTKATKKNTLAELTKLHEAKVEKWRTSFPEVAGSIGLTPKWTSTGEGPEFVKWAKGLIKMAGPFPAGALSAINRPKQGSRLLKCQCGACGYVARVTAKWVDGAGPPVCPKDEIAMDCPREDEEEGED